MYISYTRFLYDGSRLAAVVAKLCILIYTLSVLLSYYSVYIMAIIEHSGLCDSRKRESAVGVNGRSVVSSSGDYRW